MTRNAPPSALLDVVLDHIDEVAYALRIAEGGCLAAEVQFVSGHVRDVLGYEPDDFVSNRALWFSLVHPEDRDALSQSTSQILRERTPASRSYRLKHRTGGYRWMEDRVVPLLQDDGTIGGMVGVARDVTARIEEEAALAASEARFRELVYDSPDGMVLVADSGTITLVNREAERLFGYAPGELTGQPIERLIPVAARARHLRHRQQFAATPHFRPMGEGLVLRGLRKDGTTFPAEIGLSPMDFSGSHVKCLVRDLTERIQAETALRQSEERYRALFEDGLTANYIAAGDGRIISCNTAFAKLLAFGSPADAIGHSLQLLFASPAAYVGLLGAVASDGFSEPQELELRRADGTPVFVVHTVTGTLSGTGDVVEIRGHLFDDTHRKQIEAQLRQSQKMEAVGRLAGGVAHDFNNLLTVILGQAEMLREDLGPSSPHAAYIGEVIKCGQRAAALTTQLLAFSRKQILQPTVFEIADVVIGTSGMLQRLIGETVQLIVRCSDGGNRVRADRNQVEQVLANLVVNARDAMPAGGTVTISVDDVPVEVLLKRRLGTPTAQRYARITVTDTGVGMDAATRLHIFEPFFTTKGVGLGTGLGLSTVYGIVKQSAGFIDVDSEPGHGAAFMVYLPQVPHQADASGAERGDTCLRPPQGEVVFIIEDDPAVQALATDVLARAGYQVVPLSGGRHALEASRQRAGRVHLLLTDLVMPDMNGRQVAEAVLRDHPDARVVYMSGYSPEAAVDDQFLQRAGGFLQKPFTPIELLSAIQKALA